MTEPDLHQLWSDFLEAWPPDRVRQMTLEEYTNLEKDDAFIYWIESRLDRLGSIWGGSAFKFGIYERANVEPKAPAGACVWGERYAWFKKYGANEKEAFATVRGRLIEVIDAVQAGNLARIDEIDLPPVYKWKVAFHYQDRENPILFPIFMKKALFFLYREIDPGASLSRTPYHVMYETLMARHGERADVFDLGHSLWEKFQAGKERKAAAWAVPLGNLRSVLDLERVFSASQIDPEDINTALERLLLTVEMAEGDRIALFVDDEVRALGSLTSFEPGQIAWTQTTVRFRADIVAIPDAEVRELDDAERNALWERLPGPKLQGTTRYWKIAPGPNASAWDEWRANGIASIGWSKLGDLTGIDHEEFKRRAAKCAKAHGYAPGMTQVWSFRQIQPGDRIVANQGKHTVLGIGTVEKAYYFAPGTHAVDGNDYAHQIKVRWDDTTPKAVDQYGWQRTILELRKDVFESLLASGTDGGPKKTESTLPPVTPRSIILYGPPGTGKTYATIRRALELILGADKLVGLGDKGLLALFREHQARGQIEFVTFHQAYGYEEFIEGIRPVLGQDADAQVRYEIHDGVFKRIALRAASEGLRIERAVPEFDELWDRLCREIADEGGRVETSQSGKTYQLTLSSQGNIRSHPCEVDEDGNVLTVGEGYLIASKENARLYWDHKAELGPEPEQLTYEKTTDLFARERGGRGGNHYTALWIVYAQLLELSRSASAHKVDLIDKGVRVQQALDKPGTTTSFSFTSRSPQYVLIIDEINRGNMSKILGELITLLEPDKRLTARNELKLPLSYTPQHRFAVPPNLHVLGTMNTADRSIALMDVALRRRFTFEEVMPDTDVLRASLRESGAEAPLIELVSDLFETLNDRIRFLYDRDHQLGHSYFLDVRDLDSLRRVFVDRVIPMLQEYFYGSWDKICIVLGCPYDESGAPRRCHKLRDSHLLTADGKAYGAPMVLAEPFAEVSVLGFDHDDYEDRVDYRVRPEVQRGDLERDDLLRTFLGVLSIGRDEFAERLSVLEGELFVPPESMEAVG